MSIEEEPGHEWLQCPPLFSDCLDWHLRAADHLSQIPSDGPRKAHIHLQPEEDIFGEIALALFLVEVEDGPGASEEYEEEGVEDAD